jgi:hypothetical protein
LLSSSALHAADLTPPAGAGSAPPPPWRSVGLPHKDTPVTRFEVVEQEGRRLLKVDADRAYGNLLHPLEDARAGMLSWRWRVDRPADQADLTRRSGDDTALKVCALFDMPIARVPFVERQLLRLASAIAGEKLPTATLCYVWDHRLPAGTLLHNAYTHRLRYIVARGAPGRWSQERRDLAADFLRAFGDDSPDVPPLVAVAVGADSDNTGAHTIGFIDGLELQPDSR